MKMMLKAKKYLAWGKTGSDLAQQKKSFTQAELSSESKVKQITGLPGRLAEPWVRWLARVA